MDWGKVLFPKKLDFREGDGFFCGQKTHPFKLPLYFWGGKQGEGKPLFLKKATGEIPPPPKKNKPP